MDVEYWWRIFASARDYERINVYFWGLRLHSAAKTVILLNEVPSAMVAEREKIASKYYPSVSPVMKRYAVHFVRLWRILNTSSLRSAWDTLKFRGKRFESLE
jgi:hypothetical protein